MRQLVCAGRHCRGAYAAGSACAQADPNRDRLRVEEKERKRIFQAEDTLKTKQNLKIRRPHCDDALFYHERKPFLS